MDTLALLAATLSTGLSAGAFAVYAHTVMPGLRATDDRTFVSAFQQIDRHIINPWFIGLTFLGALVFTGTAAFTTRGEPAFRWVVAALVAYALVVAITMAVHVPLNDAIKAAGAPDAIDVRSVRTQFRETRWVAWNLPRVLLSIGSFTCLAWALVEHGRTR